MCTHTQPPSPPNTFINSHTNAPWHTRIWVHGRVAAHLRLSMFVMGNCLRGGMSCSNVDGVSLKRSRPSSSQSLPVYISSGALHCVFLGLHLIRNGLSTVTDMHIHTVSYSIIVYTEYPFYCDTLLTVRVSQSVLC